MPLKAGLFVFLLHLLRPLHRSCDILRTKTKCSARGSWFCAVVLGHADECQVQPGRACAGPWQRQQRVTTSVSRGSYMDSLKSGLRAPRGSGMVSGIPLPLLWTGDRPRLLIQLATHNSKCQLAQRQQCPLFQLTCTLMQAEHTNSRRVVVSHWLMSAF